MRRWWRYLWRDRQHERDQIVLGELIEIVLHDKDDHEWFETRIEESKRRLRETLDRRLK